MTQANLPVHLQKYAPRDVGQTLSQNLGTAAPPYVSIQGGRFNLIDAAGNEMPVPTFDPTIGVYLDACIIDSGDHISRVFYATKFDPAAQTYNPPDCWSDNGTGPSISATNPQSPTCASCPNAVWGSAMSAQGKQIPACSMVQKIALLIPGIPQTIFLLRVPPNSHKHLRAYVELSRGSGVNIADVITRIYFDQTTQGTLLFRAVNYIDEAVATIRESAYVEKKTDALVGRTDVARPVTTALAAPAQQQIAPSAQTLMIPDPRSSLVGTSPAVLAQQVQQPATFGQHQQVQQSGPFLATAPFATAPASAPSASAATAPIEPAPARRRRRTAAEMQAAQPAPGSHPASPAASHDAGQPLQAPFPHPGASAAQAPFPAAAAPQPQFGMAPGTPAAANPELSGMLDDFFKQA